MNLHQYAGLLAVAFLLAFTSCQPDETFITSSDARIGFSLDTLRFDTVFTELGSATRSFRVYNRNDQSIRISEVYLDKGEASLFRMNVDGIPGRRVENVEIFPNDSIWIFVEVTVDPDQPLSVSPFVVEEEVVFVTNDNEQRINLEAWGQNANYFPSRFNKGVPVRVTCQNEELIWDDPKPYVIYGEVFIDSCMLTVVAGTQIYVHGGIARNELFGTFNDGILYTLANGSLNFEGTKELPIIVQGDRLETPFQDDPGQWFGIFIGRGSTGNQMQYTTIKNSNVGVYVDSLGALNLKNTQIFNTASNAILSYSGNVTAENCLFYNNFSNSVQLINGGNHRFDYCTMASYGVDASALGMSNFFCFDDFCNNFVTNRLQADFNNCIIFGSSQDELILSDIFAGEGFNQFSVTFDNCIVRVDELLTEQEGLYADFFEDECVNCINASRRDTLFVDPNADDYRLDSLSIADGMARPITSPRPILIDLEGNDRNPTNPDIGCFERNE